MIKSNEPNMLPKIIIDTDAKNEIDDQYAITYAVLSGRFDIAGFTAAHYGKAGSMEKSYHEIRHVLNLIDGGLHYPVYKGAEYAISDKFTPVDSPAAGFIVNEALNSATPLYVVSIGAITNLASACLIEPEIQDRVRAIWLAGKAWPKGGNFYNNKNDILAAQVIFESRTDLTLIPAKGTADKIKVSLKDRKHIKGIGEIGNYLWKLYMKTLGFPKSIYDIAAIALLKVPEHCTVKTVPRPYLLMNGTYNHNNSAGEIKVMIDIDNARIKRDFFETLTKAGHK